MLGLAQLVWPEGESRNLVPYFAGKTITIFDTPVDVHRVIMVVVAVVVALALWLFTRFTRAGVTMRAVVDDRSLLQLNGGRPFLMSMLSWAIGSALAAIAGILIAPVRSLEAISLTLLVVTAYAAAAVGRLKSIPLTFLGALILGLSESYLKGYIPSDAKIGFFQLDKLGSAVSPLLLFAALFFIPQARLRASGGRRHEQWRLPTMRTALIGGVVLIVSTIGVIQLIQPVNQLFVRDGLFIAVVALSLVPLTGFAGQISLAQMTFAGLGGVIAGVMGAHLSPWGAIVGVAVTAVVGAIVALPALRLQGIYLALATAAFSMLMYEVFFLQDSIMPGNTRQVPPLKIGGIEVSSNGVQCVVLAVAFALVGIGLVALASRRVGTAPERAARQPGRVRHARPQPHAHQARCVRPVGRHRRLGGRDLGPDLHLRRGAAREQPPGHDDGGGGRRGRHRRRAVRWSRAGRVPGDGLGVRRGQHRHLPLLQHLR